MSDYQNTAEQQLDSDALAVAQVPLQISPQTLSFPQFKRLPIELRLHVWSLDRAEPRLVSVQYDKKLKQFYSPTPLPSKLLVCSESRSKAKKQYPLRFATEDSPAMVRVNFEFDTVRMDFHQATIDGILAPADIQSIRFLEIHDVSIRGAEFQHVFNSILAFEKLQQLTLACAQSQVVSIIYSVFVCGFTLLHGGKSTTEVDPNAKWRGSLETIARVVDFETVGRRLLVGTKYREKDKGSPLKVPGQLKMRYLNGDGFLSGGDGEFLWPMESSED